MKRSVSASLLALALAFVPITSATAQTTITEHTTGPAGASFLFAGQSLTIPGAGTWSDLRFTFFGNAGERTSAGSIYLLSNEYLGTPASLSAATPGFIAKSTADLNNFYFFAPSVTVSAGLQYFFYVDTPFFVSGANSDTYAGGVAYVAEDSDSEYLSFDGDANFNLSGTLVTTTTPEPGSLLLVGAGLAVILVRRRIRR